MEKPFDPKIYVTNRGWYIARKLGQEDQYLHPDGVWRNTTRYNNEYSGYYASEELARATLDKAVK